MKLRRYLLMNLAIASLSGIFNWPALTVYEVSKRILKRLRSH